MLLIIAYTLAQLLNLSNLEAFRLNALSLSLELECLEFFPHCVVFFEEIMDFLLEFGVLISYSAYLAISFDFLYFGAHLATNFAFLQLPNLDLQVKILLLESMPGGLQPLNLGQELRELLLLLLYDFLLLQIPLIEHLFDPLQLLIIRVLRLPKPNLKLRMQCLLLPTMLHLYLFDLFHR